VIYVLREFEDSQFQILKSNQNYQIQNGGFKNIKLKNLRRRQRGSKEEVENIFLGGFLKNYYQSIVERKLGSKDSILKWKPWNKVCNYFDTDPENGFFILGKYGPVEEQGLNPEEEYLVSTWNHNTGAFWCKQIGKHSRSQYIKDWKPDIYKPIAEMCESGNHVPFTDDLMSFLSHVVPEGDYIISSFIDVPRFPNDLPGGCSTKYFFKTIQEDLNITIKTYGSGSWYTTSGSIYLPNIHRGILDIYGRKLSVKDQTGWVFKNLKTVAVPLHSVWDQKRVEYYKKRMMENNNKKRKYQGIDFDSEDIDVLSSLQSHMHLQEYIPTALILSPNIGAEYYAHGGLVLDGHHKIQAAAELGYPIRVIFIEKKRHDKCMLRYMYCRDCEERKDGVCHCQDCLSTKKAVPLFWTCNKKNAVKQWKRKNNVFYQEKKNPDYYSDEEKFYDDVDIEFDFPQIKQTRKSRRFTLSYSTQTQTNTKFRKREEEKLFYSHLTKDKFKHKSSFSGYKTQPTNSLLKKKLKHTNKYNQNTIQYNNSKKLKIKQED
jgi:hypothetical protein